MKLGKLEQITDLRSVWKHEAKDFTPWLAKEENLEILSEAVGIDIVVEEQESNVGDFSVDLFATEEGTGRRIIIENQLEETNHDHLGKIITYASGKEAEVIIWIVRKARDEHKQAIEWLNQHTDVRTASDVRRREPESLRLSSRDIIYAANARIWWLQQRE